MTNKKLRKWNYETKQYDIIEIPFDYNCITYSYNMDEIVNCPHCGKQISHGESYCSLEVHNQMGFGFDVCRECYKEEIQRRLAHM